MARIEGESMRDGDRARIVFRHKSGSGKHHDLFKGRYLQ